MIWSGYLVPFAAGLALGAAYLAGLWSTVRILGRAKKPMVTLILSSALRIAVVVALVIVLYGDDLRKLFAMIVGFIVARFAGTRFAAVRGKPASSGDQP